VKANKRAQRGDKKVRKQMAYVGSVYTVAPWERSTHDILDEVHRKATAKNRPKPQNKRLWAEMAQILEGRVDRGMERLFGQLQRDAAARDCRRAKRVVLLLDGDRALWEAKKRYLPEAIGILDLYHVIEHLWKASCCFHAESSQEAEKFVTRYLRMLLAGQAGNVIGVFRRFLKRQKSCHCKTVGLKRAIGYFVANRDAMLYDKYLEAGYPIGGGEGPPSRGQRPHGMHGNALGDRRCPARSRPPHNIPEWRVVRLHEIPN